MAQTQGKYPNFKTTAPVVIALFLIMSACGVRKTIPKGEHLLKKNTISLQDKGIVKANNKVVARIRHSEVKAQILHRPNKRVFFEKVPVYLWLYALGTKNRHPENSDKVWWRRRLRSNLGEPPVLIDSNSVQLSADNIRNYLFNRGYFDTKVDFTLSYTNRKAKVKYIVNPGVAYRINSVFVQTSDTVLQQKLYVLAQGTEQIRLWWPADLNKLNEARAIVAKNLRNEGYFTIQNESFRYEIDTLNDKKEAKIVLILIPPPNRSSHVQYKFGGTRVEFETSEVYSRTKNPVAYRSLGRTYILNQYPLEPSVLSSLIYIDSGKVYNQGAADNTYQSLVQAGLFSLVDMQTDHDTANKIIHTNIRLKTVPRMSFSFEPQGLYSPQGTSGTNFQTTSQRSFGLAGILAYTNRNLNKKAEFLRISSVTSWEAIFRTDSKGNLLYGLQQGFNASLSLPHFSLLRNKAGNQKAIQRNTVLSVSYQLENNPNFQRSSFPASITFQFVRPSFSWYYTPVEISFNKNIISDAFRNSLPQSDSIFISRVFTNQFVTASKLGFIYANNKSKPGQTYLFARGGFETSGNLHNAIRRLTETTYNPDSAYRLFGQQYFQYVKLEGEIRLRRSIDELNSLALRINSAVGIPYGNSIDLPYDKRYFIGGSNSLRAWRPRRLGPGSTPDTLNLIIDRSGEFLSELNFEYRFTLIPKFLETALFLDVGNIWNLNRKNQTAATSGVLKKGYFTNELAMNTGIGFRFDFSFFLFRLDWGLPLHDPSKRLGSRWLLNTHTFTNLGTYISRETALAIGIGYPF